MDKKVEEKLWKLSSEVCLLPTIGLVLIQHVQVGKKHHWLALQGLLISEDRG